jgi:hypothetical protein
MKQTLGMVLIILGAGFFQSCESDEDILYAQAKKCMDGATTSAQAATCRNIIAGLYDAKAYQIRCAADFVEQGITASSLATAFINLDKTTGASEGDSLLGMMGAITFDSTTTSATAQSDCQNSGLASYNLLGNMAHIATELASLGDSTLLTKAANGETISQADMKAALDNIIALASANRETTSETLGSAAVSASSDYCTESRKDDKICKKLNTAVAAGATNLQIGEALLTELESQQ